MLSKTGRTILVPLALTAVLAVVAFAQGNQQPATQNDNSQRPGSAGTAMLVNIQQQLMPPTGPMLDRMTTTLTLTDDQKQQLTKLTQDFTSTTTEPIRSRQSAVNDLNTAFADTAPDVTKLDAAMAKIVKADSDIFKAETTFWISFKGILTSQQNTQLTQMRQQQMQRRSGGFGGQGGRGSGRGQRSDTGRGQ